MQTITITGNLGADATLTTVGDRQVIEGRVACNSRTKKADGSKVETTTWYKIKCWLNKDASTAVQAYLTKGKQVAVTGVPSLNVYKNQTGEAQGEIVITFSQYGGLELLGSKSGGNEATDTGSGTQEAPAADDDNDLPF